MSENSKSLPVTDSIGAAATSGERSLAPGAVRTTAPNELPAPIEDARPVVAGAPATPDAHEPRRSLLSLRHPLNLPAGSVRALLTLIVVAVVVGETARGHSTSLLWSETLMIALAHYFTSRRLIDLPKDLLEKLEQDGLIEHDAQPLFLPKHSIRTIVILSFAGLAAYLYREGRLWARPSISVLGVVFSYFLGMLAKSLTQWWSKRSGQKAPSWWVDLKAMVVLVVVGVAAIRVFQAPFDPVPTDWERLAVGLILFYFGSR